MDISEILRNRWVQTVSVGVGTFAGGMALGYILGKKRMEKGFVIYEESEQLVLGYEVVDDDGQEQVVSRTEPITMGIDGIEELKPSDEDHEDEDVSVTEEEPEAEPETEIESDDEEDEIREPFPEMVEPEDDEEEIKEEDEEAVRNVFASSGVDWDHDQEVANRTDLEPYIIHQDEFMNDEMGFSQSTLTYYNGDDILADEQEVPVYNHPSVVGELKFGHGSNNPNTVYIRNMRMRTEHEILLFEGYFEREVLGQEAEVEIRSDELKHSHQQKFRTDD